MDLAPLKDYALLTCRLLPGEPGVSFGLTIAEKNGFPAALVARAREHLAGLPSARSPSPGPA